MSRYIILCLLCLLPAIVWAADKQTDIKGYADIELVQPLNSEIAQQHGLVSLPPQGDQTNWVGTESINFDGSPMDAMLTVIEVDGLVQCIIISFSNAYLESTQFEANYFRDTILKKYEAKLVKINDWQSNRAPSGDLLLTDEDGDSIIVDWEKKILLLKYQTSDFTQRIKAKREVANSETESNL